MANVNQDFDFSKMDGPIPGQGLTQTPNGAAYQNPPQYSDLDELLESIWAKFNDPQQGIKIYGLLKAGMPAEAIARVVLFAAFSQGVCTVDLALLALPTVIRQLVAVAHLLGIKNPKIRNPNPDQTKFLAKIADVLAKQGDKGPSAGDQASNVTGAPKNSPIFSGLGV